MSEPNEGEEEEASEDAEAARVVGKGGEEEAGVLVVVEWGKGDLDGILEMGVPGPASVVELEGKHSVPIRRAEDGRVGGVCPLS